MTTIPKLSVLSLCIWIILLPALPVGADDSFELNSGDRIVFLGNSFFERALDHGRLETALTLCWPLRDLTFRNLGWDGDTVYGHSRTGGRRRAVFGSPEEGFERLVAHVNSLKPTVIVLAYGLNESFDGEAGLKPFEAAMGRLIEALDLGNTRFVFLSPLPLDNTFLEDKAYAAKRSAMLAKYCGIIREAAESDGHPYVDLFKRLHGSSYTDNGLHPSDDGYRLIAEITAQALKLPKPAIPIDSPQAETLRAAIVKKNRLYFHRWRPRNDAFVYGERKDEQKIAQTEPEQFEPFIAKQEAVIREILGKIGKESE